MDTFNPSKECQDTLDMLGNDIMKMELISQAEMDESPLAAMICDILVKTVLFAVTATVVVSFDAAMQGIDEMPNCIVVE